MLKIDPVHPGEILKDMCLVPLNITIADLAKKIKVHASTLSRIINGKASITPEMSVVADNCFIESNAFIPGETRINPNIVFV